jgi:fatty acid-binding protein DegV
MRRYGEKTFYFILCLPVSQLLSGEFSVFTVSSNMYKDKTCCGGTL